MGLKMFPELRKIMISIGRAVIAIKDIVSVIVFSFVMYAVIATQVNYILIIIRCGKDYYIKGV